MYIASLRGASFARQGEKAMTRDERLRAVTAKWRRTAAIWDEQLKRGLQGRPEGAQVPPSRDIRNWINWLNGVAREIDDVLNTPQEGQS
jgi:hypothetical protein